MNNTHVIVFDGVCNLCNWSVKFIIRRDHNNKFLFATMQSGVGQQLLRDHGIQSEIMETVLLIKGAKIYAKSDAVFEIIAEFKPAWKIFLIFRLVPKAIRDFVYQVIAKNRYRIFGKKDQCMIPSPEMGGKFLD